MFRLLWSIYGGCCCFYPVKVESDPGENGREVGRTFPHGKWGQSDLSKLVAAAIWKKWKGNHCQFSILMPFFAILPPSSTINGLPESPEHIDSVPKGPLRVQIMSSRMLAPMVWNVSKQVMFEIMFWSACKNQKPFQYIFIFDEFFMQDYLENLPGKYPGFQSLSSKKTNIFNNNNFLSNSIIGMRRSLKSF